MQAFEFAAPFRPSGRRGVVERLAVAIGLRGEAGQAEERPTPEGPRNASLAAALSRLEDKDDQARQAALNLLAEMVPWDAHAVSAMAACASEDPSRQVRLAACGALAEEAMRGCTTAAAAVAARVQDAFPEVRAAALNAVEILASIGPARAVDAAAMGLKLADTGLRWRSPEHSMAAALLAARAQGRGARIAA